MQRFAVVFSHFKMLFIPFVRTANHTYVSTVDGRVSGFIMLSLNIYYHIKLDAVTTTQFACVRVCVLKWAKEQSIKQFNWIVHTYVFMNWMQWDLNEEIVSPKLFRISLCHTIISLRTLIHISITMRCDAMRWWHRFLFMNKTIIVSIESLFKIFWTVRSSSLFAIFDFLFWSGHKNYVVTHTVTFM